MAQEWHILGRKGTGKAPIEYGNAYEERVYEWQPVCRAVYNFLHSLTVDDNLLRRQHLRFNPIQIAEWLDDLLVRRASGNKVELSRLVGMSRTRVGQFLCLMKLSAETRRRLRGEVGLTEHQLRPIAIMQPKHRGQAIRQLLSRSA